MPAVCFRPVPLPGCCLRSHFACSGTYAPTATTAPTDLHTCCTAGDALDDANFEHTTANGAILRLTKELAWIGGLALAPLVWYSL